VGEYNWFLGDVRGAIDALMCSGDGLGMSDTHWLAARSISWASGIATKSLRGAGAELLVCCSIIAEFLCRQSGIRNESCAARSL
jgi:hypothetical protein